MVTAAVKEVPATTSRESRAVKAAAMETTMISTTRE